MRRWGRFNLVGMAGFVLQLAVLSWLTRFWGWHHLPATALAVEAAIVQNYLAHARWTWADRSGPARGHRVWRPVKYQATTAVTLALNVALTVVLVSAAGLPPEAANVAAVGIGSLANFLAADRLVFTAGARAQGRGQSLPERASDRGGRLRLWSPSE